LNEENVYNETALMHCCSLFIVDEW